MSDDIVSRLLANDPSLTILRVDPGGVILDQFCSSVQENSRIRRLYIYNFDIGAVTANELSAALGRMPFLEEVTMYRCPWESVEVATALSSSLANRYRLQKLELFDCNIDGGGVQAIFTSFSTLQSLRELHLQNNPIGNVGAIAIGSLFASNESLKRVSLCGSNIGPDGFEAIARGIAQNRTTERLDLYATAFNIACVQNAFARALYNDDSIETVLTGSNHTLRVLLPRAANLCLLLRMNRKGPGESRRRKLIRFLHENPGSVGVNDTVLPNAIEKIARVGGLDGMCLLVRDIPNMFEKKR